MNDREKLVAVLNEIEDDVGFICDSCGEAKKSICIESFADHLIANGVTVQEWISVEDRLPKTFENVLVCTKYEMLLCHHDGDEWVINYDGEYAGYDYDITHWMPLPEPPKEDNHETD